MTRHDDMEPLIGGNTSGSVVRIGGTVRKPWHSTAPSVMRYMGFLADRGVDVPRHLGRDEDGRQAIEYVPGTQALSLQSLSLDHLARVGGMVRVIHDTSSAYPADSGNRWDVLIPATDSDLLCHNNLAPWNLVIGDRWVFIDWDGAGPSNRLWDLAYSAQSFSDLVPGRDPIDGAERLRTFIDAYGADERLRAALPVALADRAAAMHSMLKRAHASGREPWGTMYLDGHGQHWAGVAQYVRRHQACWREVLITR